MEQFKKCSLPPISSLLADTSFVEKQNGLQSNEQRGAPPKQGLSYDAARPSLPSPHPVKSSLTTDLPPTPPMRPESVHESPNSPSPLQNSPTSSILARSPSIGPAINDVDATMQREPQPLRREGRRTTLSNPSMSPTVLSSSTNSPDQNSKSTYHSSDTRQQHHSPAVYYPRSLPSTFPPATVAVPGTSPTGSGENPWQHHHYISASAQAAFPQSQDRYICQTCTKAFSRPSSLRIHSHSHTGEKPFKCPHHGCGKAFSVRSNMKRHERGCHSAPSSSSQ